MAMTQLALLFIGALATLATLGIFVDFRDGDGNPDRATSVLIAFVSALLWGVFALSSNDVIVRDTAFASASEPIEPLFWVGVMMAGLIGVYAIYGLFKAVYEEMTGDSSDADMGLIE